MHLFGQAHGSSGKRLDAESHEACDEGDGSLVWLTYQSVINHDGAPELSFS
jgi:hypothetical protein